MSRNNDGGPAFPRLKADDWGYEGMTLRDYFAAKVLQGIVANPHAAAALTDARAKNAMESLDVMAEIAYGQADAMLRQRSK